MCINQEKIFSTSFSLEINFKSIQIKSTDGDRNKSYFIII